MATGIALVVLCGALRAAAEQGVEVPATVEPTPMLGGDVLGRARLHFPHRRLILCARGLKLDHVRLVERPKATSGLKAAIVTAYLFHPAHIEGLPCLHIRARRRVRIRTKRPAADLVFFDGSSSPPRRIFPLPPGPAERAQVARPSPLDICPPTGLASLRRCRPMDCGIRAATPNGWHLRVAVRRRYRGGRRNRSSGSHTSSSSSLRAA